MLWPLIVQLKFLGILVKKITLKYLTALTSQFSISRILYTFRLWLMAKIVQN